MGGALRHSSRLLAEGQHLAWRSLVDEEESPPLIVS